MQKRSKHQTLKGPRACLESYKLNIESIAIETAKDTDLREAEPRLWKRQKHHSTNILHTEVLDAAVSTYH